MKKLILAVLAAGLLVPAQAQFLSPEATTGALFGTLGGAIFGGRHPGQAIAIGAASGLFLGSIAHAANEYNYGYSSGPYAYGSGYYSHYRPYGYYAPFYTTYYSSPAYYASAPAPAVTQQTAPAADPPPAQPAPAYRYVPASSSSMGAANALFGR